MRPTSVTQVALRIAAVAIAIASTALLAPAAASAAAPTATLAPYTPLGPTAVRLAAYLNPGEEATSYHFEYGPNDCGGGGCDTAPVGDPEVLSGGSESVRVSVDVAGLKPSTAYHYRLVATNPSGTVQSDGAVFDTLSKSAEEDGPCPNEAIRRRQGTTDLPECRAYELVSKIPANARNAMDVDLLAERTQAAAIGGAATFVSGSAIDGTESIPASTEYLSERGPDGWLVHGITPLEMPTDVGEVLRGTPRYLGEFSPDLSKGVFLSNTLLPEGTSSIYARNLYLRENLRSPIGEYRRVTAPNGGLDSRPFRLAPFLAGVSKDFSRVLFESPLALVPEAEGLDPNGMKLYKWVDGAGVRLVGILPESEGGGPTLAQAGRSAQWGRYTNQALSYDGSRAVFTTPPFDAETTGGRLYLRDERGTLSTADDFTVRLNASEKSNGGGPGGTDLAGPQPAYFWAATPDLSKLYFTSGEALTNDAPEGQPGVNKLYRYDLSAPEGERLTLLSVDKEPADGTTDAADGAIGVSPDGEFVYFVGPNQLQAGGPTAPASRIFVWHDGEVREVASLKSKRELDQNLGYYAWFEILAATKRARLSADGRRLLFVSEGASEQIGYDHGSTCPNQAEEPEGTAACTEVYVYEATEAGPGKLQCASCNPTGAKALNNADITIPLRSIVVSGNYYLNRTISPDGRFITFTSGDPLVPDDTNGRPDVYVFDSMTGEVEPLSDVTAGAAAYFLDASLDRGDTFFASRAQLVPTDKDEQMDLYDARVDGGFVEEAEVQSSSCASTDQCRPAGTPNVSVIARTEVAGGQAKRRRCRQPHRHRGRVGKQLRHCAAKGKQPAHPATGRGAAR
jgi:WD40-like Beta Propeller Repeat